jgi:large subunit ribosomal protein L24
MRKICKGDEVIVLKGKDKGKKGFVRSYNASGRVIVSGINKSLKHIKPNPMTGDLGGRIEREMFIHVANVAIFNSITQKKDDVIFKRNSEQEKIRIYRSNGEKMPSPSSVGK